MKVNRDFKSLFAALNAAHPRYTKDLDILVGAEQENAERVYQALLDFGAPTGDLAPADLARPGLIFQMGLPPNRIDVLTEADGVEFSAAWARHLAGAYGDQQIFVISREDLIRNKLASGRPR